MVGLRPEAVLGPPYFGSVVTNSGWLLYVAFITKLIETLAMIETGRLSTGLALAVARKVR